MGKRAAFKRNKYGNTLSQTIFIIGFLAIPISNFLVFTVYGNLGGVILSFKQFTGGEEIFVGLRNYMRFFRDFQTKNYGHSILVSLAYLPIVGGISLPLSLITSFFLYKKIPMAKLTVILLYLPNIIPVAVMAEFYQRLWDAGGGIVTPGLFYRFFSSVTGHKLNWLINERYANYALWIYTVWFGFGFNALLLWGAMSKIPDEVVESAQLDGAGLWTELGKITIPVIWPTFAMIIVLTVTTPFQIYMQPLILAANGAHGTRTIALLAIQEIKRPDPYFAAAIYILIACVSMPTVLITKKITDKIYDTVEV